MTSNEFMGLRIARYRDMAGLTQAQLADRVGITFQYVSALENGRRMPSKRSLVIAIAGALGVSAVDLVGQPRVPRSHDEWQVDRMIPSLRIALDEAPEEGLELWTLDRMAEDVATVAAARMACNYEVLARLLPPLLEQVQLHARTSTEGELLLARLCGHAALTIKPFGHVDLAMRLADRSYQTALTSGDPVEGAFGGYVLAQCALGAGLRRRSYLTAVSAAEELSNDGRPDAIAARGMLHLHAAYAGASLNAPDYTAHIDEAAGLAAMATTDPWRVEFTPDNVALWRVGIALENGIPEQAPGLAQAVSRGDLRTVQRRSRLHLDWGRALFLDGQARPAVLQLLEADDISQPEVRLRQTVKEMVGQMVRDQKRASGFPELMELAVRVGVDPLDPQDEF